jgi:hypothetical protein
MCYATRAEEDLAQAFREHERLLIRKLQNSAPWYVPNVIMQKRLETKIRRCNDNIQSLMYHVHLHKLHLHKKKVERRRLDALDQRLSSMQLMLAKMRLD